jgi:microcystin degradation protein MlrC
MNILVAECMQEISSFNPLPSDYENFAIDRGEGLYDQRGLNTAIGGALAVFEARSDVTIVPTISARAGSAGMLSAEGWRRLHAEIVDSLAAHVGSVDAIYFSLHGAMGAAGEPDPEGALLETVRGLFGETVPLVISLDLHGILTDRMLRQIDGVTVYHTYPHVDFADTGRRGAGLLLSILDRGLRPTIARVTIPMLARGDECITKTGWYGSVIADAQLLERQGKALAAAVMIGNPFTDAPELCSQAIVVTHDDPQGAAREATALAQSLWAGRHRLLAKLIPVDKAISLASAMDGPVTFTDAADATSSGASGDSMVIVRALTDAAYKGRVLAPVVDPVAAKAAHDAGVGASIEVSLGGGHDARFTPMTVTATVESLSRGRAKLETMGLPLDAGPTAVLTFGAVTMLALSRSVSLFDRAMFYANGLDPQDFDLIVVKSPYCEFHMFAAWSERDFNVDAPGSTSANLRTLGHRQCARPIYPLDEDVAFDPRPVIYRRNG